MRQSKETGKEFGYILLPILIPAGADLKEHLETTDFKAIARVITTLSTQDRRVVEELKSKANGRKPSSKDIITEDTDIINHLDVEYEEFRNSLNVNLWQSIGPANWMPFDEARSFTRN